MKSLLEYVHENPITVTAHVLSPRKLLAYRTGESPLHKKIVSYLPTFPEPTALDRILIIVPHKDDETLAAGGYMQRAVRAGATIHVVMATDGNKRGKKVRRKREVTEALRCCGLSDGAISFYNFPDGSLHRFAQPLGEQLEAEVRAFIPTIIIVTDPLDSHPDHAVLGRIVQKITDEGLLPLCRSFVSLIHYPRFPRPLGHLPAAFMVPPKNLRGLPGWCSLSLTHDEQKVKLRAIKVYKSQLVTPFLRGLMFSFDRKNELFREIYKGGGA